MRNLNLIGPQVRKLRSQRGWTQDQLAGALQRAGLDISRSGVAKVESRMVRVDDHRVPFYLNVFRVEYKDMYPPFDPHAPGLYETHKKLMNRRF